MAAARALDAALKFAAVERDGWGGRLGGRGAACIERIAKGKAIQQEAAAGGAVMSVYPVIQRGKVEGCAADGAFEPVGRFAQQAQPVRCGVGEVVGAAIFAV